MTIFNRPEIIDEAAEASLNFKKKFLKNTRKPGVFIIFELLITAGLIYLATLLRTLFIIIMCDILIAGYEKDPHADLFFGMGAENFDQIASLLFTVSVPAVLFLFAMLVQRRKLRTFGFTSKNALRHYLTGLGAGAAAFAVSILICVLTGTVKIEPAANFNLLAFILIFIGFIIQGNSEEVLCRGYMLVSISRRYPVWLGVIINSAVFAALHLGNPGIGVLPMINLFLFGFAMSILFLRTGNIWMVSAIHTSWNFVQGNLFGALVSGVNSGSSLFTTTFTDTGSIINGGAFGPEGGIAVTVVYLALTAAIIFIKPSKKENS